MVVKERRKINERNRADEFKKWLREDEKGEVMRKVGLTDIDVKVIDLKMKYK